jgi:hypothetical protein
MAVVTYSHSMILQILGSLRALAFSGQTFTHAQHRMHVATFVLDVSLMDIEPVGHAAAQVPQAMQRSFSVTGEAFGRLECSLKGLFPGNFR